MAKQVGLIPITGTIGDATYYKLEGEYYVRAKSSLCGKRVKSDPKFALTMRNAKRFGIASKLASQVYKSMDEDKRNRSMYREFASKAVELVRQGKNEEEIKTILLTMIKPVAQRKRQAVPEYTKVEKRVEAGRRVSLMYDRAAELVEREGERERGRESFHGAGDRRVWVREDSFVSEETVGVDTNHQPRVYMKS